MKQGELKLWETIFGGRKAESVELSEESGSALRTVLATLTPREESVIRRRFGIDCEPETQKAIGCSLHNGFTKKKGITGVRVDQIEAKALRKLRHPSRARELAPYAISLGLDRTGYWASLINGGTNGGL